MPSTNFLTKKIGKIWQSSLEKIVRSRLLNSDDKGRFSFSFTVVEINKNLNVRGLLYLWSGGILLRIDGYPHRNT